MWLRCSALEPFVCPPYSSGSRLRDATAKSIQSSQSDESPHGDACVEIKGYDIRALPASGVMQAAIYWALVAETCPPAASGN